MRFGIGKFLDAMDHVLEKILAVGCDVKMLSAQKTFSSLLIPIFCASCASRYQGPGPNFNARGAEQIREIQNFEIAETFNAQGLSFIVGKDEKQYTLGSFAPIMKDVSPEAYEKTQRAQLYYNILAVGAVAMLGAGIWAETQDHRVWAIAAGGASLTLISIGGIHLRLANQEAARQFNRELPKKFAPSVGYHRNF